MSYRLSYYPWITQNVPPDQIAEQVGIFAREIENELNKLGHANPQLQVLVPKEVPEQIKQLVTGGAEIALMNPLGFIFAREKTDNVEAVAVAQRIINGKIGITYFSQLYTHKKSAIRNLKEAAGKSVGYGHTYSTSNFLIPAVMLLKADIHPLCGFGRIEFLKGHEKVARAVYEGKVELGAGHDGVINDLARQPGYGDAGDVLVRVEQPSGPIPSDPVVVRLRDEEERDQLKQAIVAAGKTDAGSAALKIFWGNVQGLEGTTTEFYDELKKALEDLKLEQKYLLPA
jgi:phosphonate transport system substrate-binding protein